MAKARTAKTVKTVKIYTTGGISLSEDPVEFSYADNSEIEWECSKAFTVVFKKKSPFTKWRCRDGDARSGPVQSGINPGRKVYKYFVAVEDDSLDPGVIVGP